jgi:hypothetical protein
MAGFALKAVSLTAHRGRRTRHPIQLSGLQLQYLSGLAGQRLHLALELAATVLINAARLRHAVMPENGANYHKIGAKNQKSEFFYA